MPRNYHTLLIWLFFLLLATGCNDNDDRNELAVYIGDAPAEYQALDITVTAVEIHSGGEWTPLEIEDGRLALLTLVNGRLQRVASRELPERRTYDAIRLRFSAEASITVGGETYTAELDSGWESVTVEASIPMDGLDRQVMLDIDAAASVVETGEASYLLRPKVTLIDMDGCGAVQGGLQASSVAMSTQALMQFTDLASGEVFFTYSDINSATRGAFFIRLQPGEYEMEILPKEDTGLLPYSVTLAVERQQVWDFGVIELELAPEEEEE